MIILENVEFVNIINTINTMDMINTIININTFNTRDIIITTILSTIRIHQREMDSDARKDIVVNHVHPGYVDTDMTRSANL